ncbi:MAG: ABC transporter substrate-binding protein [Chloroflexi bacterium RBG_16_54_11]|nr:MAG: ABC transporter substrate-binding protein [Chloroflexi bacterium RBG_16_54_11]
MKHLKYLAFVLGIAILLSACATATSTAPQVIPTAQTIIQTQVVPLVQTQIVPQIQTQVLEVPATKTEVRLSGWASSPAETALLQSLLYQFTVENPDIIVKYEPITGDYRQVMLSAIVSGTEPDVFYVDIAYFREWAKEGVLLGLDDLMASMGVTNDMFIPSLIDAFTVDGAVYGIPKDFNTLGLFYNKGLFDAAGLDYPTDSWTWDDLKSAAQTLTDLSDSQKPVYGFCDPADAGRFPVFVFQAGGTVMNSDFSDTTLDSQAAIDAATYYTSFRADNIGATPADLGEGWQGTLFGKGQCAIVYEGGWLIPYLASSFPGTQYGVSRLPAGPGGKGNMIFTVSWSISANTKVAEAAWKVVDFLTNEASQTTVLQSGFALPTRAALQSNEYFTNNANSAAIFNGAYDNAVPFYWGPAGTDVNDQMGKALERVYLEGQAVADSMAQAAQAIRDAIAALK